MSGGELVPNKTRPVPRLARRAIELFLVGKAKQMGPGDSNYLIGLPDATARDGFAPVLTSQGAPLVVDMRDLAGKLPPRPMTPYQVGRAAARADQAQRIQGARRQSTEAP